MTHAIGLARMNGAADVSKGGLEVRLHGAVVLPVGDYHPDGTVVIRGDRISSVFPTRTPGGDIEVDTRGIIAPGFVDTHNHASYAVFRRWTPTKKFRGRFDWRGKTRCGIYVVPDPDPWYANNVAKPFREFPAAVRPKLFQYGQVRGLLGGATTMLVDAEYPDPTIPALPGLVRDFTDWPIAVYGVLDVGCVPDEVARTMALALSAGGARLLVHLGEGDDGFARGEFFTLKLAKKLLTANTALIHALALTDKDWDEVAKVGASVVWSPCSNDTLYGRTLDIQAVLKRGVRVALAPDWSVTGSSSILDELRFVRPRFPQLSPETLLDMVTSTAADILGFGDVGRIGAGKLADLTVFKFPGTMTRADAAEKITYAGLDDVALVMVGGLGVYGEPGAMTALSNQVGPPAESLSVPYRGQTFQRMIRFDDGAGLRFAQVVAALQAVKPDMADLWEPS